jgi:aminoglycoside phosphotransferase (APT) family kinase protein
MAGGSDFDQQVALGLMTDAQDQDSFRQLVQRMSPQARLVRSWKLTGGVSAQVTALEVEGLDGQTKKLIVRQHGEIDRAHNPHIARDEFRLLQIALAHGLNVPKWYYLDESCDLFPTPLLVIEFVDGETVFDPSNRAEYLAQMATELAHIHRVHCPSDLSFLQKQDNGFGERPAVLDNSLSEDRIRDTLESAWPLAESNKPVLLHGDYWPGNILWKDGQLATVIDWEDARVGDPLADLANCRLELLWALGVDAMIEFTERYRSMTSIDFTNLPYWDLCAALRPCGKLSDWGLDAETEQRMRERHGLFVDQAIENLPDN